MQADKAEKQDIVLPANIHAMVVAMPFVQLALVVLFAMFSHIPGSICSLWLYKIQPGGSCCLHAVQAQQATPQSACAATSRHTMQSCRDTMRMRCRALDPRLSAVPHHGTIPHSGTDSQHTWIPLVARH